MKLARILYFISGPLASAEDQAEALEIKGNVSFRNALVVPDDGQLEVCDGVAGEVPERYAAKYPTAEEAVKLFQEKLKALSDKVGDEPAPKAPVQPKAPIATKAPAPAEAKAASAAPAWNAKAQ